MTDGIYERLAAPFDVVFTDVRGGVSLTYINGEQVIRRLNEVLGVTGWDFRVIHQDIHAEADEAWVLGEILARIDGVQVVKQQYGSQKIRRSRSTGAPLDIGFDLKGAGTDAMKKCAAMLGVGLYLANKDATASPARRPQAAQQPSRPQAIREPEQQPGISCRAVVGQKDGREQLCGVVLEEVSDAGRLWTPVQLANEGQKKFKRPFCWTHYQQAVASTAKAS
jgi:hypothetical protein